jgi:DNA-directed RNA polymerase subunit M/transcription elongation factor TFIIS
MSRIINLSYLKESKINNITALTNEFYTNYAYNRIRRSKLIILDHYFAEYLCYRELDSASRLEIIRKIERSCYNYSTLKAYEEVILATWDNEIYKDIYDSICYKIISNIDRNGLVCAEEFVKSVVSGETALENIANYSSRNICPEKYEEIEKKIESRKNIQYTLNPSRLHKCGRCGSNETVIQTLQLRSLDESNDMFAECIKCHKRWKVM